MKPIEELINRDKAELLHSLFPAEIPALLQYIKGMGMTIAEEQETIRATWDNILSFDQYLELSQEANRKIEQYGVALQQRKKLFADQLFDGYIGIYAVYCLIQYVQQQNHPNVKFAMAVNLLFI